MICDLTSRYQDLKDDVAILYQSQVEAGTWLDCGESDIIVWLERAGMLASFQLP